MMKKHKYMTWSILLATLALVIAVTAVLTVTMQADAAPAKENPSAKQTVSKESTGKKSSKKSVSGKKDSSTVSVQPQWLFYESVGNKVTKEQKKELDRLVRRWTKGKLTDHELTELMTEYLLEQGFKIQTAGIMSKSRCLFASPEDVQCYHDVLLEGHGIYDFIGVYTKGKTNKYGKLICYYWEAGVI